MRGTTKRAIGWITRAAIVAGGTVLAGCVLCSDPRWAERHVLPSYCATSGAERLAAGSLRWVAVVLGIITLAVVPAAARRVARLARRSAAASGLGVVLAVFASLLVTELYTWRMRERLISGPPANPTGEREAAMARPDSRLGWSYLPRRTTWVRVAGRTVAYAIDAAGNRALTADAAPDTSRPSVLFTGESIAFGYGLPYEETFVSLVGRDLGVQTVNLAVVGYGNDQAYLRVLDALPSYRRPLAVVTLFLPQQIRRNVEPWRPRLALAPGGALTLVPPSGAPAVARLARELPYHGDEPLRVTAAILSATADAARARGAFPLFVVTNYGPACLRDDGREAWVTEELLVRQGLPFVRVDLSPEDRLPGLFERHPSLRGTQKIAAAVERALSEHLGERVLEAARRAR